jgi:hypothetical protein
LREQVEGTGQLEKWDHPDGQDEVIYSFDIETDTVETRREPRVGVDLQGRGTVRSTTGKLLPKDIYRLYCADGEIMRVQNLGMGIWTILSS